MRCFVNAALESRRIMNATTDPPDIFRAIANNDIDSLKNLVEIEGTPVTLVNARHQTTAHVAAEKGSLEALKYLLAKNASLATARNQWDENILHVAVKKGALAIVKYLIDDCKTDVNSVENQLAGDSVLHIAADEGRLNVLEYLLEEKKMDANARNQLGVPPLFLAASKSRSKVVRYLIEQRNADPTLVNYNKCNVLYVSSTLGDLTIPRYLLDERKVRIDVNWRNVFGRTVLSNAVRHNKLAFVKYLVEEKHANMSIADNVGRTPLHEAVNDENAIMIKYLLERGADVGCRDEDGRTPVQLTEDPRIVKYFNKVAGKRSRRRVHTYSMGELYDESAPVVRALKNGMAARIGDGEGAGSKSSWQYSGANNLLVLLNAFLMMGFKGWRAIPSAAVPLADVIDFDLPDLRL